MLRGLYFSALRPPTAWLEVLRGVPERLVGYRFDDEEPSRSAPVGWETRMVAPLGKDAGRFSALLKEMTGREAEYFRGRLLAARPAPGRDRDEASVANLSGALQRLSQGGPAVEPEKGGAERLWQARLFLKLAEAVTAAEFEVQQGLAAVARRQAEMLRALQGDGDEDEPEVASTLGPPPMPFTAKNFRVEDLLAAWGAVYLRDPAPEAFLITDDPEAAALLAEAVEERAPGRVVSLPEVSLGEGGNQSVVLAALREILAGKVEEGRTILAGLRCGLSAAEAPALTLRLQLLPNPEFRHALAGLSGLADEFGAAALAAPYVLIGAAAPGGGYL